MLGVFYAYAEEYKRNDCYFKDKTNLYNMYKIKLHKTSKCLRPVYTDMFCKMNGVFFDVFIYHFPRIHKVFSVK